MRIAQEVREYLEGVRYPARPEDLIATAQANGAPPSFFETLGLLPTAVDFHNLGEVAEQLERLQGLSGSGKVTKTEYAGSPVSRNSPLVRSKRHIP